MFFNIFAQKLIVTNHSLYFRSKIRKKWIYPLSPLFYYIKERYQGQWAYITQTCYLDECDFHIFHSKETTCKEKLTLLGIIIPEDYSGTCRMIPAKIQVSFRFYSFVAIFGAS